MVASPEHADRARRAASRADTAPPVVVVDAEVSEGGDTRPPVARRADDLAVLLFTAGTAGPSKAAMLTHGSLLANLEQLQGHAGLRIEPTDVALGVLPFFHVFGLNVVLDLALLAGASVALVDHFHPAEALAHVRRDHVTVIAAVPAVYAAWSALGADDAPADALNGVRLCVSGAAALPVDVARQMHARFGVGVHEGYGLTEASPVVTTSAVAAQPRAGSIGPPLPGIDVRLVDTEDRDVLEGDPGEILVRGPNVFAGYWEDPDATAQVLTGDGWLRTGDIAVADEDGWLTLVERAKDVIIVSGFNVFPGEVEEAIADHPAVAEVAVIGEPHPRTGETVVAFVVPVAGAQPDPVELLRHAGRRLARYKLPTASRSFPSCRDRSRASCCVASCRLPTGRHAVWPTTSRRIPRRRQRYLSRVRSRTLRRGRRCPGSSRRSTARAFRARSTRCRARAVRCRACAGARTATPTTARRR